MKTPNFSIEQDNHLAVVIRDLGPWDEFPTVTNGVEEVVAKLTKDGRLPSDLPEKRLFYFDSNGDFGEIVLDKKHKFKGFK